MLEIIDVIFLVSMKILGICGATLGTTIVILIIFNVWKLNFWK